VVQLRLRAGDGLPERARAGLIRSFPAAGRVSAPILHACRLEHASSCHRVFKVDLRTFRRYWSAHEPAPCSPGDWRPIWRGVWASGGTDCQLANARTNDSPDWSSDDCAGNTAYNHTRCGPSLSCMRDLATREGSRRTGKGSASWSSDALLRDQSPQPKQRMQVPGSRPRWVSLIAGSHVFLAFGRPLRRG